MPEPFADALNEQIANEFAASQQYVARRRLLRRRDPAAARRLLLPPGARGAQPRDDDGPVPARRRRGGRRSRTSRRRETSFADSVAPVEMALEQEKRVSEEIYALFELAREQGDYHAEQFMQWFVKEQVEEVALDGRPAQRGRARQGRTCCWSRTTSRARASARRAPTRPRRRPRAAPSSGGPRADLAGRPHGVGHRSRVDAGAARARGEVGTRRPSAAEVSPRPGRALRGARGDLVQQRQRRPARHRPGPNDRRPARRAASVLESRPPSRRCDWHAPPGRTEQWFAEIDRLHREGKVGSSGMRTLARGSPD